MEDAEMKRAAERHVDDEIWPRREVSLCIDGYVQLAYRFARTPAIEWRGRDLPPSRLGITCTGMRTLVGTPRAVEAAVTGGLGGITTIRLRDRRRGESVSRGCITYVIKAINAAHGRMPRLQLEESSAPGPLVWWLGSEVEGVEFEVVPPRPSPRWCAAGAR
jgi:hypothetical protein